MLNSTIIFITFWAAIITWLFTNYTFLFTATNWQYIVLSVFYDLLLFRRLSIIL